MKKKRIYVFSGPSFSFFFHPPTNTSFIKGEIKRGLKKKGKRPKVKMSCLNPQTFSDAKYFLSGLYSNLYFIKDRNKSHGRYDLPRLE